MCRWSQRKVDSVNSLEHHPPDILQSRRRIKVVKPVLRRGHFPYGMTKYAISKWFYDEQSFHFLFQLYSYYFNCLSLDFNSNSPKKHLKFFTSQVYFCKNALSTAFAFTVIPLKLSPFLKILKVYILQSFHSNCYNSTNRKVKI